MTRPNVDAFDIVVAYRVYPGISREPAVFADDKLRLTELCLKSFRASLGSLRARMLVLLDGCPPEYESLFRASFPPEQLEIVRLEGEGNLATFERQVDLLLEQQEAEIVHFAEDDYFYLPGAMETCVDFLRAHEDVDFVSPYDHPDYYDEAAHAHPNQTRIHAGRHWRTASSTCLTFLTRRETLRRTQRAFRSYARGSHDMSLWLSLTKEAVRNPRRLLRLWRADRTAFKLVLTAWRYNAAQVAAGPRRSLWVPIPALATHLERTRLAPAVDWNRWMEPLIREIERHPGDTAAPVDEGGRWRMSPVRGEG